MTERPDGDPLRVARRDAELLRRALADLPAAIPGYRLAGELARGGQGVVFEAVQLATGKRVAIKLLRDGAATQASERFEREIRILASIDHPGIVAVRDSGEVGGARWFAMDLVDGRRLDQLVERPPVRETLALFAALCSAIEAAHVRGIVHRDLKPSNVLVDARGRPHVLDFGLARLGGDALDAARERTLDGQFVGSIPWSSPEQVRGDPDAIDARTDVYALGVMLHQRLAGRFPYEVASGAASALQNVLDAVPEPLQRARPDVDADIEAIVLRCLAKDREGRYASARELGREIERFLAGEPIDARAGVRGYAFKKLVRKHRVALLGTFGAVVLIASALVTSLVALREAREEARLRERALYFQRTQLAQHALDDDNVGHAARLLDECPENMRGFEWRRLAWEIDRSTWVARGHSGSVVAVALQPSGELVASAGDDGVVRLWSVADGHLIRALGHDEGVLTCVTFSADGERIFAAGDRGRIGAWSVRDGADLFALDAQQRTLRACSRRPNGREIAFAGEGGVILLVPDPPTATCERIETHVAEIRALAWAPDGRTLYAGSEAGEILTLDVEERRVVHVVRPHEDSRINALALDPRGVLLASAGGDGVARVVDLASGAEVVRVRGLGHWVYDVCFDPLGETILTAGEDHTIKIWNVASGLRVKTLRGHRGQVHALALDADGQTLVSASLDGEVRAWDLGCDEDARVFLGHVGQVWHATFSPDGRRIASSGEHGDVRVWDASDARVEPLVLSGHEGDALCVAFSRDGALIASSGRDGRVIVWDVASGRRALSLEASKNWVYSVAFLDADRQLITAGSDGHPRTWDAASGALVRELEPSSATLLCSRLRADERYLAASTMAGEVIVWDLERGSIFSRARGHEGQVFSLAWSADGTRLASAGIDGAIRIWSAPILRERAHMRGHRNLVRCVAWSLDDARLVTGGWDGTLRVWDAESGAEALVLRGHDRRVECAAFDARGERLVSSGLDGTLRVWDTARRGAPARAGSIEGK